MAISRFFCIPRSLDQHQYEAVCKFSSKGLTMQDFAGRDWFNSRDHFLALAYLLANKEKSTIEAFTILDQLTSDQCRGIVKGLSREEVLDLTYYQIDAMLRHGLTKDEVKGLGERRIDILLTLKKYGVKAEDLREKNWLDNDWDESEFDYHPYEHEINGGHLTAIIYLISKLSHQPTIKAKLDDACRHLENLGPLQALAVSYGCLSDEVEKLEEHQITPLIEKERLAGLFSIKTKTDPVDTVQGLSKKQIELVKILYRFGLTVRDARKISDSSCYVLIHLVTCRGVSIGEAMLMINGLENYQAEGVYCGLTREEVKILSTRSQVLALIEHKTTRNGLTAQHFQDKNWFNDGYGVYPTALGDMLNEYFLTPDQALEELAKWSPQQVQQIFERERTISDFVGLTKWQLVAISNDKLYQKGLRNHHLQGKEWFDSEEYIAALLSICSHRHVGMDEAVAAMDCFNKAQLSKTELESFTKILELYGLQKILTLSPIQLRVILKCEEYGISDNRFVWEATWLMTEEQAELLKAIKIADTEGKLALIKKSSSEPNGLQMLLIKILRHEISDIELMNLCSAAKRGAQPVVGDIHEAADSSDLGSVFTLK